MCSVYCEKHINEQKRRYYPSISNSFREKINAFKLF